MHPPKDSAILAGQFSAALRRGFAAPPFSLKKKMRRGRWKRNFFYLGFESGGPLVALRLRSARGRSVGACAGLQLYRQPLPLTPAPIAASPAWGVSPKTGTPSTATLRQQGVAESLLVLACPLVAAACNIYQTRAARYKPPTPSISSANSTPAFAGRWDRKRPISSAEIFSSTVHGAFFLTRKAGLPRERKRSGSRGKRTSSEMSKFSPVGRKRAIWSLRGREWGVHSTPQSGEILRL